MAMTKKERQDFYELQKMVAETKGDISCLIEVVSCLLPLINQDASIRAEVLTFLRERLDRSQAARTVADHHIIQDFYARQEHFFEHFIQVIEEGLPTISL